ncbi:MAG: ABC transporter permease, partial [Candidatus Aminicenantes bacterium]|nr:ABC transporter permease [Candidatus Aminicenantes bacterium]
MSQAVATLWRREVIRFYRQRGRLVGALGTPLVFWILIGSGVGESFRPAAAPDDLHDPVYFYPGTILLMLLFTAIFSTISLIEDRREGFLLSVLVSPVSRAGVVLGKILGGATLAFLQGLVFLLLAPLAGISLGLGQILWTMCVMALIALSLTGLGFIIAWQSESIQGFHAVMNLMLVPMWILSGALFPFSGASSWIQYLMRINPLSYE